MAENEKENLISCVHDLYEMANVAVMEHKKTASKESLIFACLLINHMIDWIVKLDFKIDQSRSGGRGFRKKFGNANPEWEAIRDIATGVKHPQQKIGLSDYRAVEWEDDDFFDAGGTHHHMWFVEVGNKERVVAALCRHILDDYVSGKFANQCKMIIDEN